MKRVALLHGHCSTTIQMLTQLLKNYLDFDIVGQFSYLNLPINEGEQQRFSKCNAEIVIAIYDGEFDIESWIDDILRMTSTKKIPSVKNIICLASVALPGLPVQDNVKTDQYTLIKFDPTIDIFEKIKVEFA